MPGKITKISKVVGEIVGAGDVLVVMEAMKMEYNIKCPEAGKLKALYCHVGDQVKDDTKLVEIEVTRAGG
jgi:3-methylcrotonyl-CoA carboxylase alpha subunit